MLTVVEAGAGLRLVTAGLETELVEPGQLTLTRQPLTLSPLGVEYLQRCPLPADTIGGKLV